MTDPASTAVGASASDDRIPAWLYWGGSAQWQIAFRWLVPPTIFLGLAVGAVAGFEFALLPLAFVGVAVLTYNAVLYLVHRRFRERARQDREWARRFNIAQVALDYIAMFALVQLTGGAISPLVGFFVFHVTSSALLFPPAVAWAYAAVAAAGLVVVAVARATGVVASTTVCYQGEPLLAAQPRFVLLWVVFYGVSLLVTAALTTTIMSRLRFESAQAQEAVQAEVRERTRFMLQVAHNLRSPLGAAISMLKLIDQGYLGDVAAEQQAYLTRVGGRLERLDRLVAELLILGRGRKREARRSTEPVDPADLAHRIEDTFAEDAARRGLTLTVGSTDDAPLVSGDPEMLNQLLENLTSNAVKYTPEGGKVEVLLSRSVSGDLLATVSDTGIGIPEDEHDQLFREFFRASNARATDIPGTGLGLAIVRQAVDAHSGTLEFESAEGRGTVFRIRLPRG